MFRALKQRWKYFMAKMSKQFDDNADPDIQLTQAIEEAQQQHKRLIDQATAVIAAQKQAEIQLNGKMTELERLNRTARQALIAADSASGDGDAVKAQRYLEAAEQITAQLVTVEADVEQHKQLVVDSTRAAEQAKAAVDANRKQLRKRMDDQVRVRGQIEQTKLQEQLVAAQNALNQEIGGDVPTVAAVEAKIQARYARAVAASEMSIGGDIAAIAEIEDAVAQLDTQARLEQMRRELGLGQPAGPGND
jgi:phage shock protein A